jgi:hypothetical protein
MVLTGHAPSRRGFLQARASRGEQDSHVCKCALGRQQFRERKLRSRVIRECLIKWRGLPVEDATWESEQVLQHPELVLLEDKQFRKGRTVMSLSK